MIIRNNIAVLYFAFLCVCSLYFYAFIFCCILSLSRKEEMTTRNNNSFCWFLLNVYSKSDGPPGVQCWVHHRLLDEKHNSAESCGLQVGLFFHWSWVSNIVITCDKLALVNWYKTDVFFMIELIVIFCWEKMEIIMIGLNCIYLRVKSKGFFSALQPYDPLQVLSLCWVIWTNEFEDGNYIWIKVKPAWSNV